MTPLTGMSARAIAPRGGFFTRDLKWAVENEGVDEALRLLKAKPVDRSSKEPPSPTWGVRRGWIRDSGLSEDQTPGSAATAEGSH